MKTKYDLHEVVWAAYREEVFPCEVMKINLSDIGEEYTVYNDKKGYLDLAVDRLFRLEKDAKHSFYYLTRDNFVKLVDELKGTRETLLKHKGCLSVKERLASINDLLNDVTRNKF